LVTVALGGILGVGFLLPVGTIGAPAAEARAANGCSSWTSTTRPPDFIRVLRGKNGRVERVPFRKYVITVMGKEWPSYLPQAVVEAGAVAVKQYGWYHALGRARVSPRGQCYDVRDGTSDQLYKPGRARVRSDHYRAVDKTWNVRLLKQGRFLMTGYRRGNRVACGRDRTGYKLYARSAVQCARRGDNYLEILRRYYGPSLEIINGRGGGESSSSSQAAQSLSVRSSSDARPARNSADRPAADRRRPARDRRRAAKAARAVPAPLAIPAAMIPVDRSLDLAAGRGSGVGVLNVYANGTYVGSIPASA
jgi:hypothetical protein